MGNFKYPPTIKAEVIINYLIHCHEDIKDVKTIFEGCFQRNYRDDISFLEINTKDPTQGLLEIKLNRDGIYDKLPEGLFHEIDRFVKLGAASTGNSFKEEYEKQKNEIEYSRKFFQPFDSLFFKISLTIEKIFYDNISNVKQAIYNLFFFEKAKFDLSEYYINKILVFLPYLPKIRSDIIHLKFFLSYLFEADINIEQQETLIAYPSSLAGENNLLGIVCLGRTFFCGNEFIDFSLNWHIKVRISENRLYKFVEDKECTRLFNFIATYLVPAGINTKLDIISISDQYLELKKNVELEKRQYLGFNINI